MCHLTKKGKAGIWDRPRPKSGVRLPITGCHHLASSPNGWVTTPQGRPPAPRAGSARRGPLGGVMTPPTDLHYLHVDSFSQQSFIALKESAVFFFFSPVSQTSATCTCASSILYISFCYFRFLEGYHTSVCQFSCFLQHERNVTCYLHETVQVEHCGTKKNTAMHINNALIMVQGMVE